MTRTRIVLWFQRCMVLLDKSSLYLYGRYLQLWVAEYAYRVPTLLLSLLETNFGNKSVAQPVCEDELFNGSKLLNTPCFGTSIAMLQWRCHASARLPDSESGYKLEPPNPAASDCQKKDEPTTPPRSTPARNMRYVSRTTSRVARLLI